MLGRGTELTFPGWWVLQGLAVKTAGENDLMAKAKFVRVTLLRSALLGATALALVSSPLAVRDAAAKVGVTSATDGDPLGKPPQEAERVLRIGIDVQANELITTNANDRAHLVFLDGSSLTVGPNAQLTIDKFVFDPNTKTGELAISASKGVLRLVGGKISKNTPITITTPSSTIGIRGGISIHDVSQRRTNSMFVFGKDMVVQSGGQTQVATRASSMITANLGGPLGPPVLVPAGAMNAPLAQLEGKPSPSGNPSGNSSSGGGGGRTADQSLRTSGFSTVNSNQAPRIIAPGVPDNFGSGPGPRNRNPNETIVTVLSNNNQAQQQQFAVQDQQVKIQQQTAVDNTPAPAPAPPLPPPPTQVPVAGPSGAPPPTGAPPPGAQPNVQLPQTGTATYVGGMVGIVNGNRVAIGDYQNVWNFGTKTGALTATFEGARFQGNTVGANGGFSTSNGIPSSTNNRTLGLSGNFYGSGNVPAYQYGNFTVTGDRNSYNASGIFAGQAR